MKLQRKNDIMKQHTDICEILSVTRQEFEEVINNKINYYYSYPIRKKNGKKRYIDAPIGVLKEWQTKIIKKILYRYGAHPIAYGFAKNKNPILAADKHVGKTILVAMDIKNFFNSIKKEPLIELFKYLDRTKRIWATTDRKIIEKNTEDLVNIITYRDIVPQGAPSSPVVSNLYMLRSDKLLSRLGKEHDLEVTRYADDIVFSSSKIQKDMPGKVIPQTKRILRQYGLQLNPNKIHINRNNKRMRVVGIVVNEKTNIPREKWRNFRAMLHNLKTSNESISEKRAQKIRGQIEWVKSVNQLRGEQFLKEFGQLNFINISSISMPVTI